MGLRPQENHESITYPCLVSPTALSWRLSGDFKGPRVFSNRLSFSLLSSFPPGKSFRNNLMANRVGVDMPPSSSLSSTFSRLVPVSTSPTAQLTTQLRNRETPQEYRPASTDQSRGTLEQQRTTELGDEMRAVQSIYTACSGD